MRVLVVCMRTVGKGGCFTYLGQGGHVQCLTGGVNGRARITNAMRGAGGKEEAVGGWGCVLIREVEFVSGVSCV